jgi:hypothetical protein
MITAVSAGLMMAGATVPVAAHAEPMSGGFSTCKQLRADYSAGIAKNGKAARKIVKKGYRKPLVCLRVYKQVKGKLDGNGNGVACEVR